MKDYKSLEEVKKLYSELGKDIKEKENEVANELIQLGFIPFEVDQSFLSMIKKWEGIEVDNIKNYSRRKVVRSLTTLPILENAYKKRVPKELKSLLILLDAIINATDDIIDTKYMQTLDKVSAAIVIHFGNTLAQKLLFDFAENPSSVDSPWKKAIDTITLGKLRRASQLKTMVQTFYSYLLNISQIPSVERQAYEKIVNPSTSEDEIIDVSVKNYMWRGRDIDLYWDIPAIWLGINKNERNKVKKLLRGYRALELLNKDKEDLVYDSYQETKTPLTAMTARFGSSSLKISELNKKIQQKLMVIYDELAKEVNNDNISRILRSKMGNLLQD